MSVRSTPSYPLHPDTNQPRQSIPPVNPTATQIRSAAVSLPATNTNTNSSDKGFKFSIGRRQPLFSPRSAQILLRGVRPPPGVAILSTGLRNPSSVTLGRGLQPYRPGLVLRPPPPPVPQHSSNSTTNMSSITTKVNGEKKTVAPSSSSRVTTRLAAAQNKAIMDQIARHHEKAAAAVAPSPVVVLDRAVVKKNIEAQSRKGIQIKGIFVSQQRGRNGNNLDSEAESVAANLNRLQLSPTKKRRPDTSNKNINNQSRIPLPSTNNNITSGSTTQPMGNANSAPNLTVDYDLIDLTTVTTPPVPCTNKNETGMESVEAGSVNPKGTKIRRLSFEDGFQLMGNLEDCNCQFCGSALKVKEGIMLNSCLHVFCLDCIESTIQQQGIQVRCPLHDGSRDGCPSFLMEKEIIALITPEVYGKLVAQSMQNAKQHMHNIFECVTPNCEGWCEFETGTKTFYCYVCSKTNCLDCKAIHENVDCNAYQLLQTQSVTGTRVNTNNNNDGWDQLLKLGQFRNWSMDNIMDQLQACDILIPTLQFECTICMSDVAPGDGCMLQECLHMFCRDCMVEMIKHSDEPEIKCAFIDGNSSCVEFLKPREIRALLPPDLYEQHLERSVKLAENGMTNSYHCKTPDCSGWCELDEDQAGADVFKCYICKKQNCLDCKVIHEGISCSDYKNRVVQDKNEKLSEDALKKMVESGEAMNCPKCNSVVQKTSGCDWIVCSRCRTEICWATRGPRWGPAGRNDKSGGCKCDWKNRKPCVPTCQNCH